MKKILLGIMSLIGLMGLVSCEKENTQSGDNQNRDIFYTVTEETGFSGFSGTTAHLSTEAEWDALLDQFCNLAHGGNPVTFCSTNHPQTKGAASASDTPTSISTTDREELKAWMKEMERIGKTVNVSYDNGTGTWSGRAYANLGQDNMADVQTYSGTLVFAPSPAMDEPPMGGVVLAMQVNDEQTLIITLHGMIMWFETITDDLRLIEGASMTLEGVAGTHIDLQGNTFMTLSLNIQED